MLRRADILLALAAAVVLAAVVAWPSFHTEAGGAAPASWTLTPGVLNPDVTQATIGQTICVKGWTRTIRPPSSYTTDLKRKHMRDYDRAGSISDYQEDHLISLELGGHPTDPRNLWPEPYPRAAEVDQEENRLNDLVCSGEISLADAQQRESAMKHTAG
ncbi:MAG: hypothetical protein ACXWZP_01020 [Gaiellaceae bacterium]